MFLHTLSVKPTSHPLLTVFVAALAVLCNNLHACEHCPVMITAQPTSRLEWMPERTEVCQVLSVPEVNEIPHSLWGLGIAVDDTGVVFFTEYNAKPYAIRYFFPKLVYIVGYTGAFVPREKPANTLLEIHELAWDPLHKVMWGASRRWCTDSTSGSKRLPYTRIYTIEFDIQTRYAECTFRFQGLGVPGPGFPTTGLTFDPFEGPHGTLWQHIEDGEATYTPFPLTADLGTTGPGDPVYVGGYPGYGFVSGICVSPSGKFMYVSHGHEGGITIHEKLTGLQLAALGTGPSVPRRACRGMEIDYSQPGCPRLICTESDCLDSWGPTFLVTYPITDE